MNHMLIELDNEMMRQDAKHGRDADGPDEWEDEDERGVS